MNLPGVRWWALAVSALYEIFEWQFAITFGGEAASDFLGSQGDVWDAQKDMTAALLGAMTSQAVLARFHDRAIAGVTSRTSPTAPRP